MLTKVVLTPRLRICFASVSERPERFELRKQQDVLHRLFGSSAPLALQHPMALFERCARTAGQTTCALAQSVIEGRSVVLLTKLQHGVDHRLRIVFVHQM